MCALGGVASHPYSNQVLFSPDLVQVKCARQLEKIT